MSVNKVTESLKPYPMEELGKIRRTLLENGETVFDFGTGDPKIPTWDGIKSALTEAISDVSNYPSINGSPELHDAHKNYLSNRFGIDTDTLDILPTRGSKEAVFHTALCLVGRAGGKRHVIYPDPGYPVYRSSTQFAGGIPYPVELKEEHGYLMQPWDLPAHIQNDSAAIWINYPHNPTGAVASKEYLEKLINWAKSTNTVLLSDDCYVDIYNPSCKKDDLPHTAVELASEGVLAYFSLSKRSGLTGYRAGFIAGDKEIIAKMRRARANMGLGQPDFIQAGAVAAWNDEDHVQARREIFRERLEKLGNALIELGMIESIPEATFYLWAKIPEKFKGNDIKFCKGLAEKGVIASPSQWLSEGIKGYTRFALVPDIDQLDDAIELIKSYVEEYK
jgi:succinyldiaminopimelate transaminase